METKPLNVVFLTNGTASHVFRIDGVARNVNENTPHAIYVTDWMKWNNRLPEGTDLVVLELLTSPKIVDKCHELGAKVIWEADDALLDSYGDERKNLMKVKGNYRDQTIETLKKVDAVTVSREVLVDNYERFTDKPIYHYENYFDFEWYGREKLNIQRATDEIRIGWFGSQGHLEDLLMTVPALKEVLAKYPQARLIYCGFGGMSSSRLVTEATWGEDVFKDIPRNRREFYIGVSEQFWPMKHRFLDLDIGVAPLVDDYFNLCKTPIKWLEYGLLGTPTVASPTVYGEYAKDGENILLANNHNDWVAKLSLLIENASERRRIGNNARSEVLNNWDVDDHWKKVFNIYQEVCGI